MVKDNDRRKYLASFFACFIKRLGEMTNVIYIKETAPVGEPQLGTFSMKEDKDNGYTVPFVRVDSDNEAINLVEAKKNFEEALLGLLKATNSPYAEALFNDHKDNLFYIANPIGVDSPIG